MRRQVAATVGAVPTAGAVSAAVALAVAPAAHADSTSYISRLQEEVPYVLAKYGSQALLDEGYKTCAWHAQGMSDLNIVKQIQQDLPMSSSAAISVEVLAASRLGC